MIHWLWRKKVDPEPTPEDAAWEVVEAAILEYPEDWCDPSAKSKYGGGCILSNEKLGLHIWIANDVNSVTVATSRRECSPAGQTKDRKTVPPAKWQKRICAATRRITHPDGQDVRTTKYLEELVDRVRRAYVPQTQAWNE